MSETFRAMKTVLRRIWMPRLLLAVVMFWSLCALLLDGWGKTRVPHGSYTVIIVAGCRVYPDGRPSPALEWRVRKAVEMWKQKAAPGIVFTGGVGQYPPAEAEASARLAESLGVPRAAMVLEDQSTSTLENARNAAAKLEEAGKARVLLVTDAYHVFRARRLFGRYFGEVDAVGSTYGVWSRIRGAYREVLALVKCVMFPSAEGAFGWRGNP
ncbi:MAG: YdcF family protein [Verrucomicrobiota bacterium]